MKSKLLDKSFLIVFLFIGGIIFWHYYGLIKNSIHWNGGKIIVSRKEPVVINKSPEQNIAIVEKNVQPEKISNFFNINFSENFVVEESGRMQDSDSDDWWVNSGAFLYSEKGVGQTIMGKLNKKDKWRIDYRNYNSDETDDGYHPQNIFRLVTRSKWKNFNQEAYFKIKKYNLSESKHRFESNGILLFNRYQDGDNLYYTGLRVDGAVVIKKKYKKKYYLLGYKKILPGKYNRKESPNLIPADKWIGVKSKLRTIDDNQVEIKVFIDREKNGKWEKILDVIDNGKKFGGSAILKKGYAGIRTDFMDVEFDDYKIEEVE